MKNLRAKTAARFWVLVTFLAFTAQVAGASAHAKMMIQMPESADSKMPDCHGHSDPLALEPVDSTSIQIFDNCCNGDCSMMGCHAAYAVLNSVTIPQLQLFSSLSYFARSTALLQRQSPLYRPPILS